MAKQEVDQWSTTPAENTDIDSIDISEGAYARNWNNADRALMAQVKAKFDSTATTISGLLVKTNNLSDLASASTARTNLGVEIGADVQAWSTHLDNVTGLSKTDGNFIVANGTTFVAESGATARTSLGLGTIATEAATDYTTVADLASTSNGEGASLVGIEDAGGLITATTVEGALAENRTAIDAIESDYLTSDVSGSLVRAFDTVADLLADTDMAYSSGSPTVTAGDIVMAGRFPYEVAASGASDNDTATAGSVKLYARAHAGAIWLEQLGVDMTGSTGHTSRVQAALGAAAREKCDVRCNGGSFQTGKVTVAAGVRNIMLAAATWVGVGASPITSDYRLYISATPEAEHRSIRVDMDMSNGDLWAIGGAAILNTTFEKTHIYGYTNHATIDHIGVRLAQGSSNVEFAGDFNWTGYDTPTQRGIGVHCLATVTAYGGYFTGTNVRATVPCTNIRIHGTFIDGSYAWVANGTEFSTMEGAYCEGQNHRGVQFTAGCYKNTVATTHFKDFVSSAVLFSYASTHCGAVNNTVDSQTYASGEAAFNVQTGSEHAFVMGNRGYSATNYFVYVGPGCIGTVIDGNKGEGFYIGGVVVQSDWDDPTDTDRSALGWDRVNYVAASTLDGSFTKWGYTDLTGVIVQNNSMGKGYTGRNTYAYAVIQMDSEDGSSVYDLEATFAGNKVHDTSQVVCDFAVWKESGTCTVKLVGNDFRANGVKAAYAAASVLWSDFIGRWADNGAFDQTVINEGITLTGATPSVTTPAPASFAQIFTLGHTSATNVTNFTNGFNGQTIRIWGSVNATLKHDNAYMRLKGSVDTTPNSNQMIQLTRRSNVWFETGRSY